MVTEMTYKVNVRKIGSNLKSIDMRNRLICQSHAKIFPVTSTISRNFCKDRRFYEKKESKGFVFVQF